MTLVKIRIAIAGLGLLAACSCRIPIAVRGSTRTQVTVYAEEERAIARVTVRRLGFTGGWDDVWLATGEAVATDIVYGAVPRGMTAQQPAEPLHPKGVYSVEVCAPPGWLGRTCEGSLTFAFSDLGVASACENVAQCLERVGLAPRP